MILVPQPGIEPTPPAVEVWCLNHWTAVGVPFFFTFNNSEKGKKERFQDPKTENISGRVLLSEIRKHIGNLKDPEEKACFPLVEVGAALLEKYRMGFG